MLHSIPTQLRLDTFAGFIIHADFQIGSGYEGGNDSNSLRHDPMFCLGAN